jgi:hypothetical protein
LKEFNFTIEPIFEPVCMETPFTSVPQAPTGAYLIVTPMGPEETRAK